MNWYMLWKYKHWIAIAVLSFMYLGQVAYTNHLAGKLNKAESACIAKINKIHTDNAKALVDQQNKLNQASADYEKLKSEQRVKTETVTREVQKIIDRPIYLNTCFDDDGVSAINSLIPKNTS